MGLLPSTMVMMSSVAVTSLSLSVAICGGLGEEHDEQPNRTVGDGQGVVVEQPAGECPSAVLVDGNHLGVRSECRSSILWTRRWRRHPRQEAGQLFPLAGEGKQVVVEKNLVESGECLVLLVKPVEKPIGGTQGTGGVVPLRGVRRHGAAGGPGSSQAAASGRSCQGAGGAGCPRRCRGDHEAGVRAGQTRSVGRGGHRERRGDAGDVRRRAAGLARASS